MLGKQEIVNEVISQERTEIEVVEESIVKDVNNKINLMSLNPFRDDGPYDILKRSYRIVETTLLNSEFTFPPFNFLLSIPAIEKAIATFRYLRADIRLQILLTSVPQNYGCIQVSWLPYIWKTSAAYTADELLQANALLLDVASMDRAEYVIPFTSSEYALDLRGPFNGLELCEAFIEPRFLANLTGAPAPVNVQVWANFVNPELMGPVVYQAEVASATLGFASAALNNAAQIKKGVDMATGAGSWAYEIYDNVFGGEPDQTTVMKNETNGEDGVSTDVRQSLLGNVSISSYSSQNNDLGFGRVKNIPNNLISPEGNMMDMLSVLKRPSVFLSYTFTPTSVTNIDFFMNPELTVDSGSGPENTRTYCEFLSRMHRFWKGSFKMSFHFFTSPLISMRLKASINYGTTTPGLSNHGDTPVKVMPVRGHTEYTLQVPFVYNKALARLGGGLDTSLCRVSLNVESLPIGLSAAVPSVYMMVLVSCGDDFRFYSPQNSTAFLAGPGIVEKQCDVNTLHMSDFEVPFEGRLIQTPDIIEPTTNVLQLINRYSDRTRDVGAMQPAPIIIEPTNTQNNGIYDKLAQLYRFWTGSVRLKALYPAGLQVSASMENFSEFRFFSDFTCSDGFTAIDTSVWPVLEVEIPYLNNTMASPILPPLIGTALPDREAQLIVPPVDPDRVLIAAGKGFSFIHLIPVPERNTW